MYYYAVSRLPIHSIIHKFLITGHTQNEGDNAHSVIEKAVKRAKKSGPIYVPDQYAQIIRTAKKTGHPYVVEEMDFKDFYELKTLNDEVKLNMAKSVNGDPIKITEIKMIRFTKDSDTYAYKTDYAKNWIEVKCHKAPRGSQRNTNMSETVKTVSLKQAYTSKIGIDGRLKSDLQCLIENNIIPSYYARFYEGLFRSDAD